MYQKRGILYQKWWTFADLLRGSHGWQAEGARLQQAHFQVVFWAHVWAEFWWNGLKSTESRRRIRLLSHWVWLLPRVTTQPSATRLCCKHWGERLWIQHRAPLSLCTISALYIVPPATGHPHPFQWTLPRASCRPVPLPAPCPWAMRASPPTRCGRCCPAGTAWPPSRADRSAPLQPSPPASHRSSRRSCYPGAGTMRIWGWRECGCISAAKCRPPTHHCEALPRKTAGKHRNCVPRWYIHILNYL